MSKTTKVQSTTDYAMFKKSGENRPLEIKKHKRLRVSMERYGFLKCFPVVCVRDAKGGLIVKDGQHRLAIAEALGIPVWWIEQDEDFDVALVNSTPKTWSLSDFAEKYAAQGNKAYAEGLAFAREHGLPLGAAFAMLSGNSNFSNIEPAFVDGTFKVKDRPWAESVAGLYNPFASLSKQLRTAQFLSACMAACRVDGFDANRAVQGAKRCREELTAYATRDGYLEMLEKVYNYGRSRLFALKNEALMAMRARDPLARKQAAKKEREAAAVA